MQDIFTPDFWRHLVQSIVYGVIGLVLFAIAFQVILKLSPFSIRKEIEEDQNVALAVVIGAFIVGLAIIVGAAVTG